jgi:hypothetical protein
MKSITVRGIDPELALKLKEKSREEKKSINQVVLESLKKYLGLVKGKRHSVKHHDLDHFFGRWTEEEYKAIQSKITRERKVDKEHWK